MYNGYSSIRPPHPGTYDWVFDTSEFQTWRNEAQTADSRRALWISGKSGAGKSTMMKHILDHCRKEMQDHAILSFFFNARGAPLESSMLGMLRSLVYQCIQQELELSEQCAEFLRRHRWHEKQEDWQWQISELRDFLLLAVRQKLPKPVIVLVDAIDECGEPTSHGISPLIENVLNVAAVSTVPIRVCIASRPRKLFTETASEHTLLKLEDMTTTDITAYVKEKLITLDEYIRSAILEKASGCFLWAIIVVDMLNEAYRASNNDAEVMLMRLDFLSPGLPELFNVLLFPNDLEIGLLHHLLGVMSCSRRLLLPEELSAAIGLAPSNLETMRTQIAKLSRGLVEVQEGDEPNTQFIHNSVKEYLLLQTSSYASDRILGRRPFCSSHGQIWEFCWKSIQQTMNDSAQRQEVGFDSGRPQFLMYAVKHVLYHAEMVLSERGQGRTTYRMAIQKWLLDYSKWLDWLKQWLLIEREVGLLYILVLNGFTNLAQILLTHGTNVNEEGGLHGNALQAAIYRGNKEVVKLLLRHGADVNPPSGLYGSALRTALYGGDEGIIKLLLEVDAIGSNQGYRCVNGLQAAAAISEGDEDLISRLLDRGADINAQGGFYGNALQVATLKRNWKVLRLLLRHGADTNALGGFYGYALQAAAYMGNGWVVSLLLEAGANVNAEGGYYGTALQAAASQNYLPIAQDLVSQGADLNTRGGEYGSALCAASYEGNTGLVELLLEKGAKPDIQVDYYGTALQAAAYQGHLEVVKMLIANGADINAQSGEYGNALCAALVAAKYDIVEHILQHGARTDLRDSFNRTALHNAVKSGSHSMVQLLLEQGASPDDLDDTGTSPFDIAVQSRNGLLTQELLSYTSKMPLLSAKDWRRCLGWAPNSWVSFCTSSPRSTQRFLVLELQRDLDNRCFAVTSSKVIPWKKDSLLGSMVKTYVLYVHVTGSLFPL